MSTALRKDDLRIPQNATFKMQWPLSDSDGNSLPLVGYTAKSQVRKTPTSNEVLQEWTTENGGITLADSTLTLNVEASQSVAWEWTMAFYDIQLISPEGSPTRVTQGQITVDRAVTR